MARDRIANGASGRAGGNRGLRDCKRHFQRQRRRPDRNLGPYVHDIIDILARAGRRGFAFNVLSLSSDPERRRPDLTTQTQARRCPTACAAMADDALCRITGSTSSP